MELQSFECSTCQICLYGISNFQRHVNSLDHANKVHLQNIKNITDEDKVHSSSSIAPQPAKVVESVNIPASMINSSRFHCEPCQMKFLGNEPYRQHLESAGHKKKMALPLASNLGLRCVICDKDFSGPVPYEQHMISMIHKKKVLDEEMKQRSFASLVTHYEGGPKSDAISQNHQYTNLLESTSPGNTLQGFPVQSGAAGWRCDICDKYFSGPVPYGQHMNSSIHLKKLREKEILNNMQKKTCSAGSLMNEKTNGIPPTHVQGLLLKCEVCDKSFSGPVPFDQHMISLVHKKKVEEKSLLKNLWSPVFKDEVDSTSNGRTSELANNSTNGGTFEFSNNSLKSYQTLSANQISLTQFRCDLCCKSFTGPVPFDQHMSSSNHLKKMIQKTQLIGEIKNMITSSPTDSIPNNEIPVSQNWFCKTCDKQCNGSIPYKQHIISDAHCKRKRLIEIEENIKKMKNFNSVQPAVKTDVGDRMCSDENVLNSERDTMSPKTEHVDSDLIFADVLKNLNFITPETLNVTTFKANEKIVFA